MDQVRSAAQVARAVRTVHNTRQTAQHVASSAVAPAGPDVRERVLTGTSRRRQEAVPQDNPLVWEWVDDLAVGFSEIYKNTIGGGHQCADCVSRVSYTVKERILETVDGVQGGTANVRSAPRGQNGPVPTFTHE